MLWSVGALGIALVMTPLYVSLCSSLSRMTARGGHRLVAIQRGTAELERLGAGERGAGTFAVSELPDGRATVELAPASSPALKRATLTITWSEHGSTGRAEWVTLIGRN
jgi:hypothetical protein